MTCRRSSRAPSTVIWAPSSTREAALSTRWRKTRRRSRAGRAGRRGGGAHLGISAFGAIAVVFSVIFLTRFGLVDEQHLREWTAGLMYRDKRERYLRVMDRIVDTTSRYMRGNVAISVVCGTVYGITAAILGLPYPLALAVIAGIL